MGEGSRKLTMTKEQLKTLECFMKADDGGWTEAYFGYEEVRKELVATVDKLLTAERERCIKIHEETCPDCPWADCSQRNRMRITKH